MLKIIIATHKSYALPNVDYYLPIHVGKSCNNELRIKGDNAGDNLSLKNIFFCELTALYWAWKMISLLMLIVHYRH